MNNQLTELLEKAFQQILEENPNCSVYLLSLSGEINGRSKGHWGIGVHFEDDKLPGGVRHERLNLDLPVDGLTFEGAEFLKAWVTGTNHRLKILRPPRIELYQSY